MPKKINTRRKDIVFKLKLGFIKYTVYFVFTSDLSAYRENVIRKKVPHLNISTGATTTAACTQVYNELAVYCQFTINCEYPSIVHEVVHAADFIIDHLDLQGMEVRAYLVEYLFSELIKKLKGTKGVKVINVS